LKKFKKQISILFLLAAIFVSNISNSNIFNVANAQENNEVNEQKQDTVRIKATVKANDNMRNAFYIHPITLGQSLSSILFDESKFIMIYLTFEKPLSLSNSLIIKPSFWNLTKILTGSFLIVVGNDLDFGFDFDKQFRIGSDFGIRHYINKKGKGAYLQGQVGAFYYRTTSIVNHPEDDMIINSEAKSKTLWLDVMGYAGICWKYPNIYISVDFGFGYRKNFNEDFIKDFKNNLLFDINFCIGGIKMPQ